MRSIVIESGEIPEEPPALPNDGEMAANDKPRHKGRLELTWTNKVEALLSREDGSYEWVPKRDHRVAEVRLLRDAGSVGEVHPEVDRARDNLLIRGDALHALTALNSLPEFADEYAGKVKLVYIDPPFNTGQAFAQYDDGLEHSVWLTMMRDRLEQIKDLLAPDGSVWVHLDDAEMAYCRVMMDDIFGRDKFITTVIWQKADSPRNSARYFSTDHEYILVYAADAVSWRPTKIARNEASDAAYLNPDDDERGPWLSGDLRANKPYSKGLYTVTGPTSRTFDPPPGRFWRISEEKFQELDADDRIWWGPTGDALPTLKRFLSEVGDLVPRTLWFNADVGSNRTSKNEIKALFPGVEAFDTPKPERLMERVLSIGSKPGDIVLDCFAGSGSTAAVAQKMGRRWVTSELSRDTLDTYTAPRLEKVITGDDLGGIGAALGWQGGGGFRVLDVAPSMYEEDAGIVVLADWAEKSELAEVVAAQLGFNYEPDPPFHGQHGRMRLAVIDGHVDEAAVRLLVRALPEGQRLSLAATSLDPEAGTLLAKLKSGSQARAVPQDILLAYRTPSSWRASVAAPAQEAAQPASEAQPVAAPVNGVSE